MVSAKWTRQLSRSSTLASAAAIPPSAITVCALPRSDLHTRPTETPPAEASMAAPSPAGADHQHVVLARLELRHQKILRSVQTPSEQSRTYTSANATQNRLAQA